MFDNIGRKIETAAGIFAWIGIAVSVLTGLFLIFSTEGVLLIAGIFLILFVPLLVWLSSLILYGFGHLIYNSDRLVAMEEKRVRSNQK